MKQQEQKVAFSLKTLPIIEKILNFLIALIIIALLITISMELYGIFVKDIISGNVSDIIHNVLFVLILVEIITILYAYMITRYIKVERVVEVGIISIVREVIVDLTKLEATKIYAIAAILLVFGVLFYIEKYFAATRNKDVHEIHK